MKGWKLLGRAPWTAEEEQAFSAEVTALNLQRAKFVAVAGAMISLWTCGLSLMQPELRLADLRWWLVTCVSIYAVLLALRKVVLREHVGVRVRRAYVLTFAVTLIGICDGFFLMLSEHLTSVSSFSRGMLVTAVFFVLAPSRFIPMVALNELLLCGWLVWRGVNAATVTAFLDGTAGAIVACVTSWILYAAKRADFRQRRVIVQQHAEMDELMAITAHDLRSPLLGMKNLLTLATARAGIERDRLLAVVADAARACDRMLELVSKLVAAHAAEQGEPPRMERGDLRGAITAAMARVQPLADGKRLRIVPHLPEHAANASFHEPSLGQMLDNLLGNAVKFSPPAATIEVALFAESGSWRLEVRDDGPGVPPNERARLFQKYARGSVPATNGEAGSGLGLFIVKTLADRMGARVGYEPRAPRGACFRIELPHAHDGEQRRLARAAAA